MQICSQCHYYHMTFKTPPSFLPGFHDIRTRVSMSRTAEWSLFCVLKIMITGLVNKRNYQNYYSFLSKIVHEL